MILTKKSDLENPSQLTIWLRFIALAFIAVSFVSMLYLGYEWREIRTSTINHTKTMAQNEAEVARKEIDGQLQFAMQTAQRLANDITHHKIAYSSLEKAVYNQFVSVREKEDKSSFFAVSVAFGKGMYDPKHPNQLMNWYCFYDAEKMAVVIKPRDHDYTKHNVPHRNTDWYTKPVEQNNAFWEEPRFSSTTGELIAGYSVPFYTDADKTKIAGVVYINYSMNEIRKIMYQRSFRKTGYGVVFSQKGKLIFHPNETAVKQFSAGDKMDEDVKSVLDPNDLAVVNYVRNVTQESKYTFPTGEKAWVFSTEIPSTHWQLKVLFLLDELDLQEKSLSNQLNLIAAVVVFLLSLLLYVFALYWRSHKVLWLISTAVTVIFIVGIARMWALSDGLPPDPPEGSIKLRTQANITKFEQKHSKIVDALRLKKAIYVPTGVFLKSAEFAGPNNVNVTAYVWQKYHIGTTELEKLKDNQSICDYETDVIPKTKGVSFIEAIEDEIDFNCEKATYMARDSSGNVTIGWYVSLNLRQLFDYSKYPFDKNIIWLRMNHSDFQKNLILIPDIYSYANIYEGSKSGVDNRGFVLPGWEITGSYYSVVTAIYNSNWGIENFVGQITPELYFNLKIKRDFMDPFVSAVAPVIMIFLVLFIVVFASSDNDDLAGKYGFNAMTVFAILAGLLFSVALWHGGLRTAIASAKVSYFECFYIVCYILIVFVGVDSLLLSSNYQVKWLRYHDNLVVKLIFLPLTAAMVFFATLIMLF